MIGRLGAIDAAADEIYQARRAVNDSAPLAERPPVPCYVPPGAGNFGRVSRQNDDVRGRQTRAQRRVSQMTGQRRAQKAAAASDHNLTSLLGIHGVAWLRSGVRSY